MRDDVLDDNCNSALDKADQYEKEVLKMVFPNARFSESSVFGSANKEIKSFQGNISTDDLFKDTPYEFKGNHDLLHFTSLGSLIQILRNGYFRMSDFNCLDDDEELNYSLKKSDHLKLTFEQIEKIKKNIFCFSSCESNVNTITNHFMWETYANKGNGCAIEYKLTKNDPYQFINGLVRYGDDQFEEINRALKLSEEFQIRNNGFIAQKLSQLLTKILIFHKSKSYDIENEVRLVYHQDGSLGKSNDNPHVYKDIYKNQKVHRFLKLFLKGRHPHIPNDYLEEDQIFDVFPQIEIKRIVLGTHVSSGNLLDIMSLLGEIKSEYNYEFEIWRMNYEKQLYRIGSGK